MIPMINEVEASTTRDLPTKQHTNWGNTHNPYGIIFDQNALVEQVKKYLEAVRFELPKGEDAPLTSTKINFQKHLAFDLENIGNIYVAYFDQTYFKQRFKNLLIISWFKTLNDEDALQATTTDKWLKFFDTNTEGSNNATKTGVNERTFEKEFRKVFSDGQDEIFEDGMESDFSRALLALIEINDDSELAFDIIGHLILSEQVGFEVAAEALRCIGEIENPRTQVIRRIVLENCLLKSRSSRVKDAAGQGLASLDDTKSIPALRKAISKENVPAILQKTLRQVLQQLLDKAAQSNS